MEISVRSSCSSVQPRVCGERSPATLIGATAAGSAPRVRGTVNQGSQIGRTGRFSPACAGNGVPGARAGLIQAVQPRVCGERVTVT